MYQDIILIFSKSKKEHENSLRMVTKKLKGNNLKSNKKNAFQQWKQITFIGYVFSNDDVKIGSLNVSMSTLNMLKEYSTHLKCQYLHILLLRKLFTKTLSIKQIWFYSKECKIGLKQKLSSS